LVGTSIAVTALALVAGGAAFVSSLDLERFQGDAARLQKLGAAADLSSAPAKSNSSGDWPQWRGPNRDGLSPETGLRTNWPPSGPRVLWQRQIGRGFSTPAIAGGRLYQIVTETDPNHPDAPADHEAILCWDASTGAELWHFRYPNRYEERFGNGPRSTPAVDGNRMYAVGPTGIFHCLQADNGTKLWRHDLLQELGGEVPRYGVAFSPLVEGEHVFALPGGKDSAAAAFEKETGRLVWKAIGDPVGYSSPVLSRACGTPQVLFLTNTELVSVSPSTGQVLWCHPWEAPNGFNIATPVPFSNYVFVSTGYGKGCTLLEIGKGTDGAWQVGTVYEHNRLRNYFASSVRYADHLYGFDNTTLVCMEVRTGRMVWQEPGKPAFKKGSLLIADGHLIVLSESGWLSLAEATPEGYREKAKFQLSRNKCWTVPVLASGRLYVRDEAQIFCLDLRR
jgi:outer membrane protein assembly factor BamB